MNKNKMQEEWVGLKYKGQDFSNLFEVSNLGEIRRINSQKNLKQFTGKNGYKTIATSYGSKQKIITLRMHKAIVESFLGIQENKKTIHHIDFNKANNKLDNLIWCTIQENYFYSKDKIDRTRARGTDMKTAKLDYDKVRFIRENYIPFDNIFGCRALGRKFGVNHGLILNIINNKKWVTL